MNVLCLVAHADDESLFSGGSLCMHALDGNNVEVVVLSDGEGSRFEIDGDPNRIRASLERQRQFHRACRRLSVNGLWYPVFEDQRADALIQLDLNRIVQRVIASAQPELIYTHYSGDLNADHRRVAEAVLVATRNGPPVRCMTPEYPKRCVGPAFDFNIQVMFAPVAYEAKIAACLCYESELRAYPHPRSEKALRQQFAVESFMEIR